jgi:hypothetical protein
MLSYHYVINYSLRWQASTEFQKKPFDGSNRLFHIFPEYQLKIFRSAVLYPVSGNRAVVTDTSKKSCLDS